MDLSYFYYQLYSEAAEKAKTYYVSFDYKADGYPYGIDIRTHAADWNLGVPNFQICYPILPAFAKEILDAAIELAQSGDFDFMNQRKCDVLLYEANVIFFPIEEPGWEGYRIILPVVPGNASQLFLKTEKNEKIPNNGTGKRRNNQNTKRTTPAQRRKHRQEYLAKKTITRNGKKKD